MKKILVVLVLIGMAVAPELIGRWTERDYRRTMEKLSVHPLIQLSTVSYQRDWFRSRAVTALELKIPVHDNAGEPANGFFAEPLRVELMHDMMHGPLIFGGEAMVQPALLVTSTRLRLPGKAQDLVTRIYGSREPLTIDSVHPFFGEHRVRLALAGVNHADAESGISFTMEPATGNWLVTRDLAACRGTLSWPGMTGGFAEGEVEIRGFGYVFDMRKLNDYIWTGTGELDLESIGILAPDGGDFRLANFHAESVVNEEKGLLGGTGGLSFSRLLINGGQYGPAAYAVQMRNLDADVISELYARQYAMYGRLQNAGPEELAASQEQLGQELLALLPQLLEKGPEVEITELAITLPAGRITGTARVGIDNSQPALLEQLATIPLAIQADFRLSLPRVLLLDSPMEAQMNVWLTAGLLEEQGESILLNGRFAQGQLTLNGNPLPVEKQN